MNPNIQDFKVEYLDYGKCAKFITDKYFPGRDLDDFASHLGPNGSESNPYQCFWHMCLEWGATNGGSFWILEPSEDEKTEWWAPIAQAFIDEFGEGPYSYSW